MDVKNAIQSGDALALRRLLREEPSRANELIRWGQKNPCLTHPLHYISDMLFEGLLPKGAEIALVDALIEAGADLDFQQAGEDSRKGDTALIGAASLGAEDAGIKLLDAGASPRLRGYSASQHSIWAALLGEDRLTTRLIEGLDEDLPNLKDENYQSSPLEWRVYGWCNPPAGNRGRQREMVRLLVSAGAMVGPSLLESHAVRTDPAILAALRLGDDGDDGA